MLYLSFFTSHHCSSSSSSSPPPVYCLSYHLIYQWLLFFINWRRSQSAGGRNMEAKWIQKGLLSLSLFISFHLPHVFIHSLPPFISPCSLPLSICVSGDCPWKPGACRAGRRQAALPIAAYANRIICLAPEYVASLTYLHLAAFALYSAGLGWTNRDVAAEEKPAATGIKMYEVLESIVPAQPWGCNSSSLRIKKAELKADNTVNWLIR